MKYTPKKIKMFYLVYRSLNGDMTVFGKFCENLLSANNKTSKNIFAGDLNINVSDYESNKTVQNFLSSMFQYSSHHQLQYALGSYGLITQAHASMYVSMCVIKPKEPSAYCS